MVMSHHALIPSATPFGLENVKLLRRNKDANALFAHFGEGDLLRAGRHGATAYSIDAALAVLERCSLVRQTAPQ
jgi:hypothetical protein